MLREIEEEYNKEISREKDSDSEEMEMEIIKELKPYAEHIENVSKQLEQNGDVEMKDDVKPQV